MRTLAALGTLVCLGAPAAADEPVAEEVDAELDAELAAALAEDEAAVEVIVVDGEAPAESASSVHFDADDLRARPHARPADLLRQTPGLVVSQHAGGGKADQYFLRGFDADHGTDVAIFVDDVPVNLTSHGHGQGYADAHWLIPELVTSIDVHKGPYAARYGDFYTAGAIDVRTAEPTPGVQLWLTGGTELAGPVAFRRATSRLVGAASPTLSRGAAMLAAEIGYTDGPFLAPQEFGHAHVLAKGRYPLAGGEARAAATFYRASWNQSGQLPVAAVEAGIVDAFGSFDPTEGGRSQRGSVSLGWARGRPERGAWDVSAYAVDYRLTLFSNFTLYERDPVRGDQIEQNDDRMFGGAQASYRRTHGGRGMSGLVRAGLQLRADSTTADLWHTAARRRVDTCWEGANPCNRGVNGVVNVAAYIEEDLSVGKRVRLLAGLRADQYVWNVRDLDPATAGTMSTIGGEATAAIVSPKLSAIVAAADDLDVFVNTGLGFHSNDARAAVAAGGEGALARAIGGEAGVRVKAGELRASAALWYLGLASEQVWSGDAGGTEPAGATRRYGLDLDVRWSPAAWLEVDANVAAGRAFAVDGGGALALAPRLMGGGGVTVRRGTTMAAARVRGIDHRPADDAGTLIARGYVLADVVAEHRIGGTTIGVTVENLLDAAWREAQFAGTSRIAPMAPVAADVHVTPGAPRTALVTVSRRL